MNTDLNRRTLITRLAKTCLGVSLVPPTDLAAALTGPDSAAVKKAQHVIYLFMRGGMSHLDSFDTKPDAPAGYQGATRTISTEADGVQIAGYFPELAKQAKKIAFIRSMTHTQGAHEPGVYKVLTGFEQTGSMRHPSVGAWVARQGTGSVGNLPPYIRLGDLAGHPGAGFLDARWAPVPILDAKKGIEHTQQQSGDSMTSLRKRMSLVDTMNQGFMEQYKTPGIQAHADMYADAIRLMTSKDLDAFDITKEKSKFRDDYGTSGFGQGLLLARRLVERGTKFVEVDLGGWDTHSNNWNTFQSQGGMLDAAVSTLLKDLEASGLIESTMVVLTTEFGRTPRISGTGRDHHPVAFSSFIAGGGVRGGQVYGETDDTGTQVKSNPVTVHDFHATIGALMGVQPTDTIDAGNLGAFNIYGGSGGKRGKAIVDLV
jgi:Protein of unknown function (DUF1501)